MEPSLLNAAPSVVRNDRTANAVQIDAIRRAFSRHFSQPLRLEQLGALMLNLGHFGEGGVQILLDDLASYAEISFAGGKGVVHYDIFLDWLFRGSNARLPEDVAQRASAQAENRYLGVSVHHISTTLLEVMKAANFPSDATFHDIEPRLVRPKGEAMTCPRDGGLGTSYVDALRGDDHVGMATFMLSYSWGYRVRNVADALGEYCRKENLDPKRSYVWICCLCINQHRVVEARTKKISIPFEKFREEFGDRVGQINHIVALMDPWHKPSYIERVWCNFEMYCAITGGAKVSIIMPPTEAQSLRSALLEPTGLDHVWRVLSNLRIEHAQASVPEDRDRIFDMIRNGPGFRKLNFLVTKRLQRWIVESSEQHARMCMEMPSDGTIKDSIWRLCAKVGSLMREIGLVQRSSHLLEDAWHTFECSGMCESLESAYLLRQVGVMRLEDGDNNGAGEAFSAVYGMYDRLHALQTPNGALLLGNIGTTKAAHDDHRGALLMYEEAQRIAESTGVFNTMIGAILLRNMGTSKAQLRDFVGAMEAFTAAVAIHRQTDTENAPMSAILQRHMGETKQLQGDTRGAFQALNRARSIADLTGTLDTLEGMRLMMGIGDMETSCQEPSKALEAYMEANRIAKKLGTRSAVGELAERARITGIEEALEFGRAL